MTNLPLLDSHLRTLRLPAILANYRRISGDDPDKISYLHELAALEVDKRHENGVRARIAAACLTTTILTARRQLSWPLRSG